MARAQFTFRSQRLQFQKRLDEGVKEALEAGVLTWQNSLLRVWSGQRTGKRYRIPETMVFYTASAPGEAPANPTGTTRRSYSTEVDEKRAQAYLGSPMDVAVWLERGTQHMAPRPAIKPAAIRARDEINRVMQAALRRKAGTGNAG